MKYCNTRYKYIYTILLIIISLVISILYYQNQQTIRHDNLLAEQLLLIQKNKEKRRSEISSLFDEYLNNFKNELHEKAKLYKKSRKILKSIISPHNFENQEYTKENYFLFKNNIAPDLRAKSAEIIVIFQKYKEKINAELDTQENDLNKLFLSKWQEMSHEQLNKYINFFTKEDELIQTYDELITFYYIHSKLFKIDLENNKFIFTQDKYQKKEEYLHQKIKQLNSR